MGTYIAKRVLQFIPVFLGVTIILFVLQNVVPGDPIRLITGGRAVPEQTEEIMRINNHLIQVDENGKALRDENGEYIPTSLVDRYLNYMNNLFHGDLGTSYQKKVSVTSIFAQKYPYTVRLAACAIALEAIMGIGAGVLSAIKRYSFWDILVTLFTSIMVAIPAFWLGMLLQWFFGILMKQWTGGAFSMPISGAGGPSSPYYDWMHYNPKLLMRDVAWTNDPFIIRQNPKVMAVNSALEVDITGQVCADSIGTRIFSGVGGQHDFMYGGALSEGGKIFIALPSQTKGISKIVNTLTPGAGVVTTRFQTQYVVTEYGVACLLGKTLAERAKEMIKIAHPDVREALEKAAYERYGHEFSRIY